MSLLDTASLIVTPNGYKEGKLYSVIPSDGSGDLSVTRATTATRVNSAGLVELVPYNLVQYSEQFDNAAWTKSNVSVTANSTTAPNGTMTADTIVNTATSGILLQVSPSLSPSQLVTFSVYLKRSNNDWANVAIARNGATTYGELYVWFNIATGAVGSNLPDGAAVLVDADIENVGDGWYRCSVTGYVPNAVAYTAFVFNASADNSFTTSIGQSRYQWGAQLVEGTIKPYQKTETRLNIPRLDYSNGTCPSLLVEPQRTNLLTYSENLTQWTANIQIASTQLVANPLTGVNNATKITKVSGANDPWVRQIVSAGNGTYTYSVYLWTDAGQQTDIEIYMYNASISEVYTLSITLTTTPTRYEFDATFANTGGNITARIDLVNTGDQYIYAYGAQLEAGSYPTSYIPTTSASVTRNADVISKTGISSLIGQTEGSVFLDLYFENKGTNYFIQLTDGTNDFIELYIAGGIMYFSGYNGATQWTISTSLTNARHKIAYTYKTNDIALYVDGVLIGTDTSAAVPTCSNLYLNQELSGLYNQQQFYNSAALWKTRLTNTQLAQLTTI